MKQLITTTLFLAFIVYLASAQTEHRGGKQMNTIAIARSGSLTSSEGQTEYFRGLVRVDPLFSAIERVPLQCSSGASYEVGQALTVV